LLYWQGKKKTMGLADLHIHTLYSYDACASVVAVLKRARRIGLDVIAITDHDEIRGALKALDLAHHFDIEVIPGTEVTTADGDLLAFNITKKIPRGLPLIDTILLVGDLGGYCIAPHPMAGGIGMKSLSALSILTALHNPNATGILLGIETYNATALDRMSNHSAHTLAEQLGIARTGSSDAHMSRAIGLGATLFEGHTATDLLRALRDGKTKIFKQKEWNSARILGSWAANYLGSAFTRLINAAS
jgi:predicted metal-dependent phosphoesterase TrpH